MRGIRYGNASLELDGVSQQKGWKAYATQSLEKRARILLNPSHSQLTRHELTADTRDVTLQRAWLKGHRQSGRACGAARVSPAPHLLVVNAGNGHATHEAP